MARVAIEDLEEEKEITDEELKMLVGGRSVGGQSPFSSHRRGGGRGKAWPKNYTPNARNVDAQTGNPLPGDSQNPFISKGSP